VGVCYPATHTLHQRKLSKPLPSATVRHTGSVIITSSMILTRETQDPEKFVSSTILKVMPVFKTSLIICELKLSYFWKNSVLFTNNWILYRKVLKIIYVLSFENDYTCLSMLNPLFFIVEIDKTIVFIEITSKYQEKFIMNSEILIDHFFPKSGFLLKVVHGVSKINQRLLH